MNIKNKDLIKRIIDISYRHNLSHIGSCITTLPIIKEIYDTKKPKEKFILSAGHAHLAHLVVMEEKGYITDLERKLEKFGIHCDIRAGCDCSTGSLGQGLPIAVGMALADRSRNVYCLISDGECAEGSIQEALRIAHENNLNNLKIYLNFNGFAAYRSTKGMYLVEPHKIEVYMTDMKEYPEWLQGQQAHYVTLDTLKYMELMEILK